MEREKGYDILMIRRLYGRCENILTEWVVSEGYIENSQVPYVSGITVMTTGEDEGVDLRLDIDRAPIDLIGEKAFLVKRRVGTSDKSISKERYSVISEGARQISPKELAELPPESVAKIIQHVEEIIENPYAVEVRLKYANNMPELSDPA